MSHPKTPLRHNLPNINEVCVKDLLPAVVIFHFAVLIVVVLLIVSEEGVGVQRKKERHRHGWWCDWRHSALLSCQSEILLVVVALRCACLAPPSFAGDDARCPALCRVPLYDNIISYRSTKYESTPVGPTYLESTISPSSLFARYTLTARPRLG